MSLFRYRDTNWGLQCSGIVSPPFFKIYIHYTFVALACQCVVPTFTLFLKKTFCFPQKCVTMFSSQCIARIETLWKLSTERRRVAFTKGGGGSSLCCTQ